MAIGVRETFGNNNHHYSKHIFAAMKITIAAFFLITASINSYSQNALPKFSVRILNKEKNQISWKNPYSSCVQLSVQRSYDSLRFFTTIFSSQSP